VLTQVVERDEVALGEVENVDVVSDGGAVAGGVVCLFRESVSEGFGVFLLLLPLRLLL
jgi:hypothetical protein